MRRIVLSLLLAATPLAAQQPYQPERLTAEDYARAERMLSRHTAPLVTGTGVRPSWLGEGRFWYHTTNADGHAWYRIDARSGAREPLFRPARLAAALSAAAGEPVGVDALEPGTLRVADDGRAVTVRVGDARWRCALPVSTCAAAPAETAGVAVPENASVSPDGRRAVFIREGDLHALDLQTGVETRLTTDGTAEFGYATDNAGWTHSDRPVLTWSPDGRRIATFQHDGRGVDDMYLVTTNVGSPRLERWKYPLPGDSVIFRIHRLVVDLDAEGGPRVTRFQMPPDAHRSTVSDHVACGGNTLCDAQWYPDGSHLAFVSSSRDHKQAWFRVADARTGEVRTLFRETSPTQIGDAALSPDLWRVLPESDELIWWSQRDGWTHLYLYDLRTGELKNRITAGDGNVNEIVRVDEDARQVYFLGQGREPGRDPYYQHLYRVGFDGRGLELLTPEDANHQVWMSPDGRWFVDSYSTPDTPPVTVLRDRDGRVRQTLERADASRLLATGWRPPTPIRMKARDGATDIYGLMFTPTGMDSTQAYPIVNHIYPGPQSGSVRTRSFVPAHSDAQALAELGFVVVQIDGMGTPGRSKAFHDAYYGRMNDNTLPDQIAGMRELAARHPWIDLERAGIWGHSGGGFATAAALFRHPDFFQVGVSQSGNHDQRNYEDDWGERYQGLLVRDGDGDNYAAEANQTHAANLRGKLLLAHGAMDDNVPPYNTLLVADALIEAGKDFDLLIFPHARHGYGGANPYMTRRRWDYFVEHLLGAEPPREYPLGQLPVGR